MPCGDHLGPLGLGPKTGRRRGRCAGFDQPGYLTKLATALQSAGLVLVKETAEMQTNGAPDVGQERPVHQPCGRMRRHGKGLGLGRGGGRGFGRGNGHGGQPCGHTGSHDEP
jgi:hypothetical protein